MTSETTDAEWLRRAGRLTAEPASAWPTDQLLGAEVLATRLVALARALPVPATAVARARAHPSEERCGCAGPDCPLAGVSGGAEACRLALDLAERAPACSLQIPPAPDIPQRYLDALREAAGAVYFCRRVQHAGGRCWFSTAGPDDDLCGRVLAAAHAAAPAFAR